MRAPQNTTLILLIMALLVAGLAPATAQTTPDMGVALNPDVSGDITFWHFWGSPQRRTAVRRVVALCQQALPNITVEEVFKPFGDIWSANLAAVAARSGVPDVIVEDRPQLPQRAADGIQSSLQPYVERDGFDSARFWGFTWEQTLFEGEPYGIPFETDVRVLYINRNLFTQAGLDPDSPPTTWDELEAVAEQLTVIDEDGTIQRLGFHPLLGNGGADVWAVMNGHEWVVDGRPQIDTPELAEALAWIRGWNERVGGWEAFNSFRSQFSSPPNDAFMSGRVAMLMDIGGYNSTLSFFRPRVTLDDGSTPNIEWSTALLPGNPDSATYSGGFALSIPTGAPNPDAAWEFIKCATSPVAQVSWARDTSAMPTDRAAANDPVLLADPAWATFAAALETAWSNVYVDAYPNWSEQFRQRQTNIWDGTLSIEDALRDAQAAVDAEL